MAVLEHDSALGSDENIFALARASEPAQKRLRKSQEKVSLIGQTIALEYPQHLRTR